MRREGGGIEGEIGGLPRASRSFQGPFQDPPGVSARGPRVIVCRDFQGASTRFARSAAPSQGEKRVENGTENSERGRRGGRVQVFQAINSEGGRVLK